MPVSCSLCMHKEHFTLVHNEHFTLVQASFQKTCTHYINVSGGFGTGLTSCGELLKSKLVIQVHSEGVPVFIFTYVHYFWKITVLIKLVSYYPMVYVCMYVCIIYNIYIIHTYISSSSILSATTLCM